MKMHKTVPSDGDLQSIPRWARVALIARTLRRVQPLLLASWPTATKKFQRNMDWAIAEGEAAAAAGGITPDLHRAGMAAMDVYGNAPMDADIANQLAFAASRVSFCAQQPNVRDGAYTLEHALAGVESFQGSRKVRDLKRIVVQAIWKDLALLQAAAQREKWTSRTPVTPEFFGPMWPNGLPPHWPATAAVPPVRRRRRASRTPILPELGLPADLIAFLEEGRELAYDPEGTEIGLVGLKPLSHLRVSTITVTTMDTPMERKDPHRDEDGYYELRIVDFIGESDDQDPEGLLAWFCDYAMFGAWDNDHHTAIGFPKATWSAIAANPVKYLDAQWNPDDRVGKHIEPWKHCAFVAE